MRSTNALLDFWLINNIKINNLRFFLLITFNNFALT